MVNYWLALAWGVFLSYRNTMRLVAQLVRTKDEDKDKDQHQDDCQILT